MGRCRLCAELTLKHTKFYHFDVPDVSVCALKNEDVRAPKAQICEQIQNLNNSTVKDVCLCVYVTRNSAASEDSLNE